MMIELIRIEPAGPRALELTFSDGSHGRSIVDAEIARDTFSDEARARRGGSVPAAGSGR